MERQPLRAKRQRIKAILKDKWGQNWPHAPHHIKSGASGYRTPLLSQRKSFASRKPQLIASYAGHCVPVPAFFKVVVASTV